MSDYENNIDLDAFVEEYTRHEDNLIALEDSRFGEIYLEDAQ
jgi:hypothetical protein